MITCDQLLQKLRHLYHKKQHQPVFIVAIDGYAGAGKSTLAAWLAQQLPASQIIALDDFYRPLSSEQRQQLCAEAAVQAYVPTQYIVNQVLRPLCQGQAATWQALDWLTQDLSPIKQVLPQDVVIMDGVFSTHKHFMPWVDATIMVSTPIVTCQHRVVSRPQPDTVWMDHWQAAEAWFHRQYNTQDQADWVIAGDVLKDS
ncbi:MAG: (d)CMP kinase [Gammaproteobacteria bacterium]|jgi:uridine kinase|nr:(d)CMP kinase [Gammaproteobacteria bacterium]